MGLGTNEAKARFLSISRGKICLRLPEGVEPQEGQPYRERTETVDNVEHNIRELAYGYVTGKIVDCKWNKTDHGIKFNVTLEDDGDEYILSLPYGKKLTNDFIKKLPAVDVLEELYVGVATDNTDKTFIYLKQEDASVKSCFTKDEPNGLPKAKQNKAGKWDYSAQEEFLYDVAEGFCAQFKTEEN